MQYKLGVIGDPIEHSLSPKIHSIFSKQTNIDIDYQAYHVLEDNLDKFLKDFFSEGGDGLNITLPHKINCLRSTNNYSSLVGLSNEVKQKLDEYKPPTIGHAAQIQGVTPASLSVLMVHLKKQQIKRAEGM